MLRLVLALILVAPAAAAQGGFSPFALPGLPVSTHEVGVAQALAAGPSDNPYVLRHNPALLADAGERPALRFGTSVAPNWFGVDDLFIGSSAASIGIDAGEVGGGSVRIGLGGGYSEYRVSNFRITDAQSAEDVTYDTEEREITGGLALGWAGPLHVRVGAGVFARESLELPPDLAAPLLLDRDRVTTLDVGGAVSYPILRGPSAPNERAPEVEVTGAYVYRSAAVLSEDFYERIPTAPFPSETFPTAPPEEHVVGGSVRAAFVRQLGRRGTFRIAEADVRAETLMADAAADRTRLGATLVLAETLALRAGHATSSDRNTDGQTSIGAEFRLGGLVRAIGTMQQSASMLALADRLTTRFEVALLNVGKDTETTYAGLTLGWRP